MNIQDLVAQNKLKEAIDVLIANKVEDSYLLGARYSRAMSDKRKGILDNNQLSVEINKITYSILDSAKGLNLTIDVPVTSTNVLVQSDIDETALLHIIKTNKRRRPKIAEEASSILDLYRTWKDTKRTKPTFDPVGRRLKIIKQEAIDLIDRLHSEKEESLESIIAEIEELLKPNIPLYAALAKAYKLASGRGLKSVYIEEQLKAKPNDDEVRISIAEMIEEFTLSISAA